MFLYAPNGKVLSQLAYQKNGSNWAPIAINALTNYLYLGGKALSYAENNVGSNGSGTYWPYGSTNTNPTTGPSTFATYLGDWSGLYYADQRYYEYNWGRFLTADPSNQNIDPTVSGSYNRYAYANGDPANGMDANGLGDGPGEGCVYETPDTMVCFSGPVVQVPSTGSSSDPVYDTGMTIKTSSAPASLPDAPTYLASDGGPNDPTAASQGQSAPTGTQSSAPNNLQQQLNKQQQQINQLQQQVNQLQQQVQKPSYCKTLGWSTVGLLSVAGGIEVYSAWTGEATPPAIVGHIAAGATLLADGVLGGWYMYSCQ
jgi:RHS repeat-associated protein